MSLDNQTARDGDAGFIGFASRLNPLTLPAGMLQEAVNVRLDQGVAQTRKGAKRLGDSISAGQEPVTLPFAFDGSGNGPTIRNTYTGGIFAAGIYSSPLYDNADEYIVLAGPDSAFLYRQNESIVTITYPTSPAETIESTDTVSLVQCFDRLYLLREADKTATGYTEKLTDAGGITVTGTNAVISLAGGAHGYSDGMRVRIEGGPVAAFSGQEYDITDADPGADTSHIQITVPSGTASNTTAGIKVRRVKPPLYWAGTGSVFTRETGGVPAPGPTYRTLRSVGWGSYISNRLWIPDGRDTVAISDYLDANTYDPYWQSFRANDGSNDYLVAITPWVDNSALVFMRKSIWLAEVGQTASTDGQSVTLDTTVTRLTMLTNEIGCAARNSIARAGQYIFFYSDSGVYRLDTQLDLKLRGDTKPLSDPINDKFASVDKSLVHRAFGVWFNNRYYLALPSTDQLSGNATNDLVFAWSALNNQWEFQDRYAFGADYLIVSDYSNQRRLFSASRNGKLMLLDEMEAGDDAVTNVSTVTPVEGRIRTRRYAFSNLHSKRFLRSVAEVSIPASGSVQTSVNIYNPDQGELQVGSITNSSSVTEDYNLKSPIRKKGHSAELVYETSAQRPAIRSVSIEATIKNMADTETRDAA
jgi:hypothetical protein